MGLDSHIMARDKPTQHQQIYNKLVGEETAWNEVLYWRKEWDVVEFFGDLLGVEIENCEWYEITESHLNDLLLALESGELSYSDYDGKEELKKVDIILLKTFLNKTDFTKTEVKFTNWW